MNSVDLLTVVSEYPRSNSKQRLQRFTRMPGGQIATALVAATRLGCTARYVGSFGSDEFGDESRESLVAAGVDVTACRTVDGARNQFAVIIVDAMTGDRTVLWDRDPLLGWSPDSVPAEPLASGRMLIVDAQETAAATHAARHAREAGIPTVIDVEVVRPGIGDLLRQIDVIVAAEEFPPALTGHEHLGHALAVMADEFGAPVVCVTLGREGSLARCAGREIRTAGFRVDCIDTTGAGDVFRGAFAAACLKSPDGQLEDALAYANAAAALNCRALGARAGIAGPEEIEALLAEQIRM
jgi:sugar/nucleoside kinase (ribokinase family)